MVGVKGTWAVKSRFYFGCKKRYAGSDTYLVQTDPASDETGKTSKSQVRIFAKAKLELNLVFPSHNLRYNSFVMTVLEHIKKTIAFTYAETT